MKLFKNIALTLASLLALSCSKEAQPEHNEELLTVQFGVSVDAPTKGLGDGKTANYVWYALYRSNGTLVSECTTPAKIDADGKAICPVTMARYQDYKVVFLAMYYEVNGDIKTPAYAISALNKSVSMPDPAVANSDNYDLFYGVDEVVNFQGPQSTNVQLNRIVAQINFELGEAAWNTLAVTSAFQSSITISGAPRKFDFFTREVSDYGITSFTKSVIPFEAASRKIGTAYCLTPSADQLQVEASIILYGENGTTEVKATNASSVPVAINKQTNLIIN